MNALDTNVLVYVFDLDEAVKGPRAIQLIESMPPGESVLLWQVACELSAVLTRIGPRAKSVIDPATALASIRARFPLAMPQETVLDAAWRIRAEFQVSIWDSLLIAACADAGVTRLYTEDLQGRRSIHGVEFVNPFE